MLVAENVGTCGEQVAPDDFLPSSAIVLTPLSKLIRDPVPYGIQNGDLVEEIFPDHLFE